MDNQLKIKELREDMGALSEKMSAIVDTAEQVGRDMTNAESTKFDNLEREYEEKKKELRKLLLEDQREFAETPPSMTGQLLKKRQQHSNGSISGGRELDDAGNIRLYKPHERLALDNQKDADIDLGAFLSAIATKPRNTKEREVIQRSVDSSGYSMPTYVAAQLVDKLRASNPLISAGARSISINGLDSTKVVTITADPTGVWHTELADESFDDPTFGAVSLSPHTVMAPVLISRETLQDANNVGEALTNSLVGALNTAILNASFTGSAGNEPTGLATTVTQTEEYTNGGSPDWSNFVNAEKLLFDNNVSEDNRSFIMAPDIWQTMALLADNNGRYQDAPSAIRDRMKFTSSGVPAGVAYDGDFSNVVYGWRLNITLEQYNGPYLKQYATAWLAAARLDMAVFRPSALVRIEEAAA